MAVCNKCGLEIEFKKNQNGKWVPGNPDGSDHWDICKEQTRKAEPKADQTKQGKTTRHTSDRLPEWDGTGVPWE